MAVLLERGRARRLEQLPCQRGQAAARGEPHPVGVAVGEVVQQVDLVRVRVSVRVRVTVTVTVRVSVRVRIRIRVRVRVRV